MTQQPMAEEERHHAGSLGVLAQVLAGADVGEALAAIAAAAARVRGACAALVYAGEDDARLRLAAAHGVDPAPATIALDDRLRQVACEGGGLRWDASTLPGPCSGLERFPTGAARGVPARSRRKVLILVAGEEVGRQGSDELEALAAVASAGLTSAELNADRERLAELVRGALEISAHLIEAGTPAAVEQRLLEGLVNRLGMSGAALWAPSPAADGVELVRAVGVPDEVLEQVRHLSASSAAAALARAPIAATDDEVPVAVASSGWPGHFVRLVEVPEPARGVLGVYSTDALPRLVDGVLATLAHGLAIASHLTALHARTRSVVDALQSELRPASTVLPDGIEVGCVYQSATAGVDVGGDFYDVFATERGELGVVCGDVSGKGIEAASLTAMAVHSLRAYALYGAQPQTVVQLLNGMVCERTGDERFMTLTYARIRPETWEVDLAVAGHPPPLVLGPQGVREVAVPADLPVGIAHDAVYEPISFLLAPGEALVLYTDGVTEARRHGAGDAQLLGIEGLMAVLGPLAGRSADEVAKGIWEGVQDYAGGGTSDDCAIVVVRRSPEDQPDFAMPSKSRPASATASASGSSSAGSTT